MRLLDQYTLIPDACKRMRYAAIQGTWNGKDYTPYFEMCRWQFPKYDCTMIFTRDVGYHSGGWWKNPMYERCWHLSISYRDTTKATINKIINNLFGEYKKLIWVESPYTETGKKLNVWHYRVFCDENWVPILPKGEVYSTQFTELGWKSFSELNKV